MRARRRSGRCFAGRTTGQYPAPSGAVARRSGGPAPAPQSGPQRILLVSGADPGTARLAPWLAALPAAQWQARAAAEVRPADLAGVDVLILDRPPGGLRLSTCWKPPGRAGAPAL
ncbi:hypothetical protein ACFSHQ_27845 [Gemmobacter lanyuensis]